MSNQSIDRRGFIGSVLAGAAIATSPRAFAATELMIGDMPVIALSDGHFEMPADMFLGTPQSLRETLGSPVRIAANTYAVRGDDRTFLFDAGAGTSEFITRSFPTAGKLPADLQAAGIGAEEVSDIVITHMHPDHAGGLAANGRLAFPNARIHISAAEWDFWNAKDLAATAPQAMRAMVAAVQQISRAIESHVIFHSGSANLGSGINLIPAPGHTPGHTAIVLDRAREQLILVGDLAVHEAVHFANPDYGWALDIDGEMATASRKSLLDMIATDGYVMAAAHVSTPGLGRVKRAGDGFRFIPLDA